LRLLELAWGGYYIGEWTQFVALSVYAFGHGGASAVGVFGVVRMGAAAVVLPFGGLLTDRYPRQRVLLVAYLARALLLATTALALASGASRALVFALAALAAMSAGPVRPATMSLVPLLARTPEELVAANVSSSAMEGIGTLVGPILGGVLSDLSGGALALGVATAVNLGCASAVVGIRREGEITVRASAGRGFNPYLGGMRALRDEPHPRLIVLLFAAQTLVRGLLNVMLTVAALGVLSLGRGGLGGLNATLGAGAVIGGLATVGIVTRRRLASVFALGLVLWGAPITLIGLSPTAALAFACVAVIGIGNALLDVSGFTLLQRTVDEHVLGRVFSVFEVMVASAVAAGSALAAIAIAALGLRSALLAAGLVLPLLALLSLTRLRAIDRASPVPQPQLALIAAVPLFAPLPVTTLERLAYRLQPLNAPAGTAICRQGDPGDSFFVVEHGEIEISQSGRSQGTLRPGDSFGEIALLRGITRTATCVARTDARLFAVDRDTFIAAVSGDSRASAAAETTAETHLAAGLLSQEQA
jgi:MFS family permease